MARRQSDEDALFDEWFARASVETMECRVASRHRLPRITDPATRVKRGRVRQRLVTLVEQTCEWCGTEVVYNTDGDGIVQSRRSGYNWDDGYLLPKGAGRMTKERRALLRLKLIELRLR
jgi:hypothetical protein